MPTVGEMKDRMTVEVRKAAERCDIMVGSVTTWPTSAMSAFLDACGRLTKSMSRRRRCEWIEVEEGSGLYNTCMSGEEFQLKDGFELFPFCHWCGGRIKVGSFSESESGG